MLGVAARNVHQHVMPLARVGSEGLIDRMRLGDVQSDGPVSFTGELSGYLVGYLPVKVCDDACTFGRQSISAGTADAVGCTSDQDD